MESEFLKSLIVIFGVSAAVVFLLHRLKIPSLVGFLVAGIIIGPYGIGWIEDTHSVDVLAEIGVILLLFTLGIEFSMSRLVRMKKAVIGGGSLQVLLTIALSAVAVFFMTGNINRSVFFGFLVALSSTAIVLKGLAEKGETDTPHGRTIIGILIFQDLCIVPLMLLVPILSGGGINVAEIVIKMFKAVLIIAAVVLSSLWIVPQILHQVVRTRSRELFIITIILLCIGTALFTSKFGLSLSLGAFLAGLIISESEYSHQATSDILPFKESFMGLFFVSVGMLLNIGYVFDNYLKIAIAVIVIFLVKLLTGFLSAFIIGSPLRTSITTGLGLAQIGEFSFVLAVAGKTAGLISEDFYQVFLSSSVVTMMLTPFLLKYAPSLSAWAASRHVMKKISGRSKSTEGGRTTDKKQGHVIIIGFGLNGRNLARVLRETDIPYTALEMNSDTVREMKKKGEPIYYGDATSMEMLHKVGIETARLLVVAISDPASTRGIVSIARHENPGIYIIVRTRYLAEVDELKTLGADEVIPEEFETSIEIFSRALRKYNFPNNIILEMIDRIRSGGYAALRKIELQGRCLFEECDWLPEIELDGHKTSEGSHLIGKSIAELQIRKKTGVTIIAIRRGPDVFTNPSSDFRFSKDDIILFTGDRKSMDEALNFFKGKG